MKKAIWLAFECKKRHWDNCKVLWRMDHGYSFALSGLIDGQSQELLLAAWDHGVHAAHADQVDGVARSVEASATWHARRWLAERTKGTRETRIDAVRRAIHHRKPAVNKLC